MNEEQAVLDFFAQAENLLLALSVAEQTDNIRLQMNNDFWHRARARIAEAAPDWRISLTEDRNVPDCYVGLHLQPSTEQSTYLRPMMEQQLTAGEMRIYFGLVWNTTPVADATVLPQIARLREVLQSLGFKSNEGFLAWRWTALYPRRKHFLLRLSARPDELLNEATAPLLELLAEYGKELNLSNAALRDKGASSAVSLDNLRMNLQR